MSEDGYGEPTPAEEWRDEEIDLRNQRIRELEAELAMRGRSEMSELAKKLDELSEIHAGENPLTSWLDDAAERIRGLEAVERAMAEDLVKLAERCDKLQSELRNVVEMNGRMEARAEKAEAEVARLKQMLAEATGERLMRKRIGAALAVEQAMGEDLVNLAERCDKLEAENARLLAVMEKAAEAIDDAAMAVNYNCEHITKPIRAALDEKKSLAADSRAPGC